MSLTRLHDPEADARAFALAILGVVAALISLLTVRLLPVWRGCGPVEARALLRVQVAMVALAGVAWRQMETPSRVGARRMQDCADTMHEAVLHLVRVVRAPVRRVGRPATRRRAAESGSTLGAHPTQVAPVLGEHARDGPAPRPVPP